MRLLMRGHLLLMTWLLWLQVWRDTGAQTVCPYNETLCDVDADMTNIYRMRCGGYGVLEQLPPACTETRVISNLVIREFTTVYTLQHRILDGLRVRQLELTGLGIRSIVVSAFEAISSDIEVLYLQDNQLESLPLGVFRTLRYLTRLQLHNNQLTQLSEASFDGLTNLVYLTLNLNRISVVEQRTWYKMPALTTLVLENNLLGNGRLIFPYMALQRLEELRLDNNRLREINADITFGVPNLRRLSFRSNSVESLPYRVFHATPRLQVVDLSANNISELTRDSFDGSVALAVLLLDENRIQQLPENLFLNLNTLRVLRLRENEISNVDSNSFSGLVGLRELDLTGNRIPSLPLGIFDPLGLLQKLSFADNEIRLVARMPFQSCRDLRTLDMANNLLPGINADWFVSTTQLTSLKLANNRIQSIEARAFDQLQLLEELDLEENYLSNLGNGLFAYCRSLRKLNLARNPLRRLASPGTTFSGLVALTELDLTGCCITELVLNSSAPLPALTKLYLGDNLLTNVTQHSLAATTGLQRLDLSDNIISAVEAGALSPLANLAWLNLSRNLLSDDEVVAVLRTVPSDAVVDVSWNPVSSPSKVCRLDAALTVFGPRFVDFDAYALSSTSAQLSWNISDELNTVAGYQFTFTVVENCTNASVAIFSLIGNETSYTTMHDHDVNLTTIDVGNLTSGVVYLACADVLQTPRGSSNQTSVSDTQCACIELPAETTTALPSTTEMETTTEVQTTTATTTTTTSLPTTTTLTTTTTRTTTVPTTTTPTPSTTTTKSTTTTATTTTPSTTTTTPTPTTTTTQPTTTTTTKTTTTTTPTTTTSLPTTTMLTTTTTRTTTVPTTTTLTPSTTTTNSTTTTATRATTPAASTTKTTATTTIGVIQTTTRAAMTTTPMYTPPADILIWARSNETAIFVTWVTVNTTDRFPYFWLICFDDENRQVASADVDGYSYVIGNLLQDSMYNVCITAITFSNFMDPTYCVVVRTAKEPTVDTVSPSTNDTGLFLIIVIAVPIGCLLLVLIIICIVIIAGYRRRRRNKPTRAEMTSSSTCDSSTGNGGQPTSCDLNSPPPATMNLYDEVVPSAPPIQEPSNHVYWNNLRDPLPLQSTLSLHIYDNALSY